MKRTTRWMMAMAISCGLGAFGCGGDDDDAGGGVDLDEYCTHWCECTAIACFEGEQGMIEECIEECEPEVAESIEQIEETGCVAEAAAYVHCVADNKDSCECGDDADEAFLSVCEDLEEEMSECAGF